MVLDFTLFVASAVLCVQNLAIGIVSNTFRLKFHTKTNDSQLVGSADWCSWQKFIESKLSQLNNMECSDV